MTGKQPSPVYSKQLSSSLKQSMTDIANSARASANFVNSTRPTSSKVEYYPKPKAFSGSPKWFTDIRNSSNFMPAKVKPVSYSYMALVEEPYRAQNYAAGAASTQTALQVGDVYHKPSEDVGTAIKRNQTIWQDIRNLGGSTVRHGANLLGRLVDLTSVFGYASRNMILENAERLTEYEKDGLSGGEVASLLFHAVSPVSNAKAAWEGFTLKKKTSTTDILETLYPNWTKEHKLGTELLGITGDIAIDPVTWLTMGTNPGSITRAGGGLLKLAKLDTVGAKAAMQDTVFTAAGRASSKATARSDALMREASRLARISNRAARRGDKTAAGSLLRKANAAKADLYKAKAAEFAAKKSEFIAKDLHGAELARLMLRQNLSPFTAMSTASRLSTGAKAGSAAIGATQTVKDLQNAYYAVTAAEFAKNPDWQQVYELWKGKGDFKYKHGASGTEYTVKLSEAKTPEEFFTKLLEHSAPIAKFAEHGVVAARSRGGRIRIVEARANSFRNAFEKEHSRMFGEALTGDMKWYHDVYTSPTYKVPTKAQMEDPAYPVVKEADFDKGDPDELLNLIDNARKSKGANPRGKPRAFILAREDGTHRFIKAEAIVKHARQSARQSVKRGAATMLAAQRTKEQRAIDLLSGVGDDLAARRAEFIANFDEVRKRSDTHNALVAKFIDRVDDYISRGDYKTYLNILNDESIPMEERIRKIIDDDTVSDNVVDDLIESMFNIKLVDGKLVVTQGSKVDALSKIPDIIKLVLANRWNERVVQSELYTDLNGKVGTSAPIKGSSINFDGEHVTVDGKRIGQSPLYQRDVNAEIAMGLLDGYRAGLHYATQMHLMENDAVAVFNMLEKSVEDIVNGATADVKAQVMMLMYNMSGVRLPEKFVPTHKKIANLFNSEDGFKFFKIGKKDKAGNPIPVKDQDLAWNNLFKLMQQKADGLFGGAITVEKTPTSGFKIKEFAAEVERLSNISIKDVKDLPSVQKASEYMERVLTLRQHIHGAPSLNGDPQTLTANHYTFTDFLTYSNEILKAQTTTIRESGGKARAVGKNPDGSIKYDSPPTVVRAASGRLSALDSFAFITPEVEDALKAIESLKTMANSRTAKVAEVAQHMLAKLYMDNGGREILNGLSGGLSDREAITNGLNSLGTHAMLKEATLGKSFGSGHAAQLMDALWDVESLNHEWQKAMQHKIMGLIVIDGKTPEQAAKLINESIDATFSNHDRLKRILHPVVNLNGEQVVTNPTTRQGIAERIANEPRFDGELKREFPGSNPTTFSVHRPQLEEQATTASITLPSGNTEFEGVAPFITKDALANADNFEAEYQRRLAQVKATGIDITPLISSGGTVRGVFKIDDELQDGVVVLGNSPEREGVLHYVAPGEEPVYIGIAGRKPIDSINEFMAERLKPETNMVPHDPRRPVGSYRKTDVLPHPKTMQINTAPAAEVADQVTPALQDIGQVVNSGLRADEAVPTPTAGLSETAPEADVNVVGGTSPSDFSNTHSAIPDGTEGQWSYTEEEMDAVRGWIATTYADKTPGQVAKELHNVTVSLTADLQNGQYRLIDQMKHLKLKNQATIRFMGQPFVPIGTPMNATHSLAGVTVMDQSRSTMARFVQNILSRSDPATQDNWASRIRFNMTRQSHLVEGTLNDLMNRAINQAAASRTYIIGVVNEVGKLLVDGEYAFKPMQGLNRKQRMRRGATAFFDPMKVADSTAFDEFNLATPAGKITNPLSEIESTMVINSNRVWNGIKLDSQDAADEIGTFNRYAQNGVKLKPTEVEWIKKAQRDGAFGSSIPFTREWMIKVSQDPRMANGTWSPEKLKSINLTELHMSSHDAALRIEEGRRLYSAIWAEYGYAKSEAAVKQWNEEIITRGVDDQGRPLRSPEISIKEIREGGYGIAERYIPISALTDPDGTLRYVPAELIPHIKLMTRYMDGLSEINAKIDTAFLHKVLNYFKASVTIYKVPTYPVRNLISDVFLSAMDGVTNPRWYRDAARVMQNRHHLSEEIDATDFSKAFDQNYLRDEYARTTMDPDFRPVDPAVGAPITTMHLRGVEGTYNLSDPQIMKLYREHGIGMGQTAVDIKQSVASARMTAGGRAGGSVHDVLRNTNEWREDWSRLAHFMYALEREAPLGGTLEDIARRAATRVKKHHFDYNDVSLWERRVLGQWVPFYKWIRNIIPYTIASVITRPYMLKVEQAITQATGAILDDNRDDPRTDFVVPDFIERDKMVDIGWYADPNGNKYMQWAAVNLPLSETLSGLVEPVIGPAIDPAGGSVANRAANVGAGGITVVGGASNPIFSGAIEAMTKQHVWQSGPQPVKSPTQWVNTMAQIAPGVPMAEELGRLLQSGSKTPGSDKNSKGELLKNLGVISLVNNSETNQTGELRRLADQNRAQRDQITGEIKNKLMKKYPQLTPNQADELIKAYLEALRTQQKEGALTGG